MPLGHEPAGRSRKPVRRQGRELVERLILAALALGVFAAPARSDEPGQPLISSFSSAELGGNAKAWSAQQASDGVLYFGADLDLLSFDGDRWRAFPFGRGYALRGIDFSADGRRLWAGGTEELGWFEPRSDGTWDYHSLVEALPENLRQFKDCWYAFALDQGALFVTRDSVFRWDGKAMRVWSFPNQHRLSAMRFDGTVFVDDPSTGLYRFDQGELRLVIPSSKLGQTLTFWIGRVGLDWLLATADGLVTWDGGSIHPYAPEASAFVRANSLTSAASLPGSRIALGTLTGGIAIVAADGRIERILDKASSSLPTDEIFSLNTDREGGLWVTSSAHIFRIALKSGALFFDRASSPSADPFIAVASVGDRVLAATPTEIHPFASAPPMLLAKPLPIPPISYLWSLVPFENGVLFGHQRGVDFFGDGGSRRVWSSRENVFAIAPSREPGHFFAARGREIIDVDWAASAARPVASELPDIPIALAQDGLGRLWIGTTTAAILVIANSAAEKPVVISASRLFSDLPQNGFGDVRATPAGALYLFAGTRAWFLPARGAPLQSIAGWPNRQVDSMSIAADGLSLADPDGTLWIVHPATGDRPASVASLTSDGQGAVWRPHSIDGLWKVGAPAAIQSRVNPATGGDTLFITGSNGILRIGANAGDAPIPPPAPLVWVSAQTGADKSFQPIAGPLPYSTRKVLVRVAVPTFARRPAMQPQILIDGIDSAWSPFDSSSARELTGLRDGVYTAHIRVLTDTGLTSPPVTLSFSVRPPWWRTPPFEALFLAGIAAVFYCGHLFRVRNLRRRASELEATVKRRTEQADRANAAKSEFIARVSHNIRNPLNGIVGLTLALTDTPLQDRQRELLEALDACARQLTSLIDDVLDFSRIEAGKVDLKPIACSLQALFESITTSLAARAAAGDSMIETLIDPALPAHVMVDAHRLEEILLNYLTNAIRYAPGPIVLRAGRSRQSPNILECSVQDRGPGFTEEEQDSLFTKYTRLAAVRDSASAGTGLGLALCRRLADLMSGSVGVESSKGAGARFFVRLPLIPADAPQPEIRSIFRIARALIVEDADYNAWAFTAVLAHLGISACDRARDGREALNLFRDRHYDLILLDRHLPDTDGIWVAQSMRKIENHRAHTLIVCVSAYSTTDDRDRCLAAGMDYFAGKPLTPEKLSQILREAGVGFRPAPSLQIYPREGGTARIDLSILEYLATGSGAPLARQIERYVAALQAALAELQSIISSADFAETETKAHAILGMAKYVDARSLADLASAISGAARKGDLPELAQLNQRLQEAAGRLIDELNGGAPTKS